MGSYGAGVTPPAVAGAADIVATLPVVGAAAESLDAAWPVGALGCGALVVTTAVSVAVAVAVSVAVSVAVAVAVSVAVEVAVSVAVDVAVEVAVLVTALVTSPVRPLPRAADCASAPPWDDPPVAASPSDACPPFIDSSPVTSTSARAKATAAPNAPASTARQFQPPAGAPDFVSSRGRVCPVAAVPAAVPAASTVIVTPPCSGMPAGVAESAQSGRTACTVRARSARTRYFAAATECVYSAATTA